MNRWPCVALAWGGLVCLLLALSHQDAVASLNSHPRIACFDRTVDPLGEPAPASPTAAPVASSGPSEPRAGPLQSLAAHFVLLTERDVRPASFDTRGPPGSVQAAWVNCSAAGKAGSPKQQDRAQPLRKMRVAASRDAEKGGFATAFS